MATPEQIRATVETYVASFGERRDDYVACFTTDGTVEDPVGTPVRTGHADISAFWDETHGLSDATRLEITGPVRVAGNEAAFPMRAVVTLGGSDMVLPIIDVMTFDDDAKITAMRAFWDFADLAPRES